MNPAWRFHKGAVEGAETKEFNDKDWTVVSGIRSTISAVTILILSMVV